MDETPGKIFESFNAQIVLTKWGMRLTPWDGRSRVDINRQDALKLAHEIIAEYKDA